MATVIESTYQAKVGEAAGQAWHLLDEQGPLPLTKLLKQLDASREVSLMALGWLAREEKIEVEERGRRRVVSLV